MKKYILSIPHAPQRTYPFFVGTYLLEKISTFVDLSLYTGLLVITDRTIAPLYLDTLKKNLHLKTNSLILPQGEAAKDILYTTKIWNAMLEAGLDRKSLLINLGGGVIGDLGGFAASTYMRGIDFINIPTTLLAQIDANIGGKTGINFAGVKNLVGNFAQPKAVIADVTLLKTLPEREFISGFAEIIKHGLVMDKKYFSLVTGKKSREFSDTELIEIIMKSCKIKAKIVQQDEKESGGRKLLNFGHTVGHAVEAISFATNKPLLHGEAISIGMVIEADIAKKIGLLDEEEVILIKNKLTAAGLPVTLPAFEKKEIIKKMRSDKKNREGKINFTLLKRIGEGVIDQIVAERHINEVLTNL